MRADCVGEIKEIHAEKNQNSGHSWAYVYPTGVFRWRRRIARGRKESLKSFIFIFSLLSIGVDGLQLRKERVDEVFRNSVTVQTALSHVQWLRLTNPALCSGLPLNAEADANRRGFWPLHQHYGHQPRTCANEGHDANLSDTASILE